MSRRRPPKKWRVGGGGAGRPVQCVGGARASGSSQFLDSPRRLPPQRTGATSWGPAQRRVRRVGRGPPTPPVVTSTSGDWGKGAPPDGRHHRGGYSTQSIRPDGSSTEPPPPPASSPSLSEAPPTHPPRPNQRAADEIRGAPPARDAGPHGGGPAATPPVLPRAWCVSPWRRRLAPAGGGGAGGDEPPRRPAGQQSSRAVPPATPDQKRRGGGGAIRGGASKLWRPLPPSDPV